MRKKYGSMSNKERIKRLTESIANLTELGYTKIVTQHQIQLDKLKDQYEKNI